MIAFACTHCQRTIRAGDELAGKRVRCSGCSTVMVVPASLASGEPTTLPPPSAAELTAPPSPLEGYDSSLIEFLAPAQTDDELGRLGGYRILEVLGHGGMGVVFLADDPELSRKVAIKAMLPELAHTAAARQRFLREARAVAALEHDHIVRIYRVMPDQATPFIVMPLLKGEPLERRLQRDEPIAVADIVRIGRQTASGLACAHAAGLVHRDIKPSNLWLESVVRGPSSVVKDKNLQTALSLTTDHGPRTTDFRVKILDFGLARGVDDKAHLTQSGAFVGTPAYTAPEQAKGETVDGRADLFSLGCVLYRLCAGRVPFQAKDSLATLVAIATEAPVPVRKLNPAIPEPLAQLVMALLAKAPSARPASAQRVATRLAELETLADMPTEPDYAVTALPAPRKRAAVPLLWLLIAGVGALAVGGGLLLTAAIAFVWLYRPHGEVAGKQARPVPIVEVDRGGKVSDADQRADTKKDRDDAKKDTTIAKKDAPDSKKDAGANKEPIPPPADRDRTAAEWALAQGAALNVSLVLDRKQTRRAQRLADLPNEPFRVTALDFGAGAGNLDWAHLAGLTELGSLIIRRPLANNDLALLRDLPALKTLELHSAPISDDGLTHLKNMPALETLQIDVPEGTNGVLNHLHSLPGLPLKKLHLVRFGLAGDAMVRIGAMASLDILTLVNVPITDNGLVNLEGTGISDLRLENTNITTKGLGRLLAMPKLVKLFLSNFTLSEDGGRTLGQMTNLTDLQLIATQLTDDRLMHLKDLKRLTTLQLASNAIGDPALVHLQGLTALRVLNVANTRVTDKGLVHLRGLTGLQTLVVTGSQVSDAGIMNFKQALPNIAVLANAWADKEPSPKVGAGGPVPAGDNRAVAEWALAHGAQVSVHLQRDPKQLIKTSRLADLPKEAFHIVRLSFSGSVADDDLRPFAGLSCLNELAIYQLKAQRRITDAAVVCLKDLPALKVLELSAVPVTDAGLAQLAQVTTLERLKLQGPHQNLTGAGLVHLQKLPKLNLLMLENMPLAVDALANVRNLPGLQTLMLETDITDEHLTYLAGAPVSSLTLSRTRVTDKGLLTLRKLPNLKTLQVNYSILTAASLQTIAGMNNLTKLDLSSTQLTDDGLAQLKGMNGLNMLNLSVNPISDGGLAHLQGMTKLETLWLGRTPVTDKGLVHLRPLENLEVLSARETEITPQGIAGLKKFLKRLK
jgi:eukaryotic-like serine/threonine-protein kinase